MYKETKWIGLLVGCLLVVALAAAPALAGDASNMAERIKSWEASFNAGDAKALAGFYAEDASRLPYQAPTLTGRTAIVENIQATREQGIVKIELELLGSESQGNMAWAHGTYHLMSAGGSTVQKGKWMNVSKKAKGEWLIQSDIWNTNAPE